MFTRILERLSAAGLVRGNPVGIDATTLRSARRCGASSGGTRANPTRRSFGGWRKRRHLVETPTRADHRLVSPVSEERKTSNKEWKSPQDPDAKVAKMKSDALGPQGRARGRHGHGGHVAVTVQDASDGDTATLPETLIMAAEQVELVQPDMSGGRRGGSRQGVPRDETLVALGAGRGSSSRIGPGPRPTLLFRTRRRE